MLQLILGRSGTGKTHEVYSRLCDLAWSGSDKLILLVPEQFSFESERALLRRLGPRMATRVRVLSFTRLSEQVLRETGGLAGRRMDDASRTLMMSRAVELVADGLVLYRGAADDPGVVSTLLHTVLELKQCGITPLDLEKTAASLRDGALHRKLSEIALLYNTYEALVAGATGLNDSNDKDSNIHYIDPLDNLAALKNKLPQSDMVRDAHVFVDSFKGFTAPEIEVLRVLMRQARIVTVTLCADSIDEKSSSYSLFSPVAHTAAHLRDIARQDGVEVAKVQILNTNLRTSNDALKAAEAGLFSPCPDIYEQPNDDVMIVSCCDIYEECDFVAREIRRRLRIQGGRCRDYAIVARNLNDYHGILDAALQKQSIPYILDERADILTEPLITLALSALDTVTGGFDTDDILRLLKTGLAGFSTRSVSLIENYVLMWHINGAQWRTEWTGNPDGLDMRLDSTAAKRLWYLNLLRRRIMRPLEKLYNTLFSSGANGHDFAKALYQYLMDVRADRLTRMRIYGLDKIGEHSLAERMEQIWDLTMQLLDKIAVIFANQPCKPKQMTALLRMIAGLADMGALPQSLDAVQVGAADRIRFSSPKTVFIIGANEGVFPAYTTHHGILTEQERRKLILNGLNLSDTAETIALEERFFAYSAVAAPLEKLVVSYILSDAAGETKSPSIIVHKLRNILPQCLFIENLNTGDWLPESERDAFEYAASMWRQPTARSAALRQLFSQHEQYAHRLSALDSASAKKPASFVDSECARRLFGKDINLSASRVESYHLCRFAYYCKYGLKAEPRRTADLDALAFGTLAHWVMEHVVPEYAKMGFDKLDKRDVYTDAADAVRQYANDVMGGIQDKPSRFEALLNRLAKVAGALLWQVVCEMRQSRFVPVDFELNVGYPTNEDEPFIPPVVLTLPDGCKVRVYGKIDRVDVYKHNGVSFVRVIDYKTGARKFRLSDVIEGINVQMLLYLFTIWQNGSERYGEVAPAGVLYLPAKLPVVQVQRDADEQTVEREQIKMLRMNGLLIDDAEIVEAMEASAAGIFIPAKTDANGGFKRGSDIASLEQFGLLKKKMEGLLVDMANTLRSGDIAALPAMGQVDACRWCEFRSVCGHEPYDPVRFIAKRDDADILKELKNGGHHAQAKMDR